MSIKNLSLKIFCAPILFGCATQSPSTPNESIVVSPLVAQMVQEEGELAQDDERIRCRTTIKTGTRLSRRVCRTHFEDEQEARKADVFLHSHTLRQ